MEINENLSGNDVLGFEPIMDGIVIEIPSPSKKEMSLESVPTSDRWGNPRWIKTKMCYCQSSKLDSCNITPGRTECPSRLLDKSQRTPGIWLYATNPAFGKAPEEVEEVELVGEVAGVSTIVVEAPVITSA